MLGRKLHSGTFKSKKSKAGLVGAPRVNEALNPENGMNKTKTKTKTKQKTLPREVLGNTVKEH